MKTLAFSLLPAALCAALVFSGCKKASESVTEKIIEKSLSRSGEAGAKVDISKGKMSIKTDKGEMEVNTGGSVKLPADFPKDVYVAKGASVQTAMKTPEGFMLQMQSAQKRSEIAEAYGAEMKAQGWEQEASMDMENVSSRTFKKEKRQVAVIVSQNDKVCELVLTVTAEK
jgi:ABC-type enterochelin transport system substrate-binding protein